MNINKMQVGSESLSRQESLNQPDPDKTLTKTPPGKSDKTVKSTAQAVSDQVSVGEIWSKAARAVDVRDATPREIIGLSRTLYEAGAISYDDHINLSFQPEIMTGTAPDALSEDGPETKPFNHQKKDYVAIWQARQDSVIRYGGNREQIEDNLRIQSILTYLDSLR